MIYYENCRGALGQCSTCLGDAERACERDRKQQGLRDYVCAICTSDFAGGCDRAKAMCFGQQECGPGYSCVKFSCVDDSS